jgi:hypothetical protein
MLEIQVLTWETHTHVVGLNRMHVRKYNSVYILYKYNMYIYWGVLHVIVQIWQLHHIRL